MTAIFTWWFEHVFALKSLREGLKRDFGDIKMISFKF